jgi:hypothetical protein
MAELVGVHVRTVAGGVSIGLGLETVSIPERFRGPPGSANGGYCCGLLACHIDGAAEVTLLKPPPLEKHLRVSVDESSVSLLDGEEAVARARSVELDTTVPKTVSVSEAGRAAKGFAWFEDHPFPGCFVCGPDREEGDGLRIFPGPVEGRSHELVAAPWDPDETLADPDGMIIEEVLWAALDCPTSFGGGLLNEFSTSVLGRLTGKLLGPVEVGRPHVLVAWPIGMDGRKWEGGSALFTDTGELKAYARGLWIELKK